MSLGRGNGKPPERRGGEHVHRCGISSAPEQELKWLLGSSSIQSWEPAASPAGAGALHWLAQGLRRKGSLATLGTCVPVEGPVVGRECVA